VPAPAISEASWQRTVTETAAFLGWLIYHTHDSRHSVSGFPDLVLVRERIVYAELKTETGKMTAAQRTWQHALVAAEGEHHVWRPADYHRMVAVLKHRQLALGDELEDADDPIPF
jgi:hypothetical protein